MNLKAWRAAPVSALPPDHAQELARDRTPITRNVQMAMVKNQVKVVAW